MEREEEGGITDRMGRRERQQGGWRRRGKGRRQENGKHFLHSIHATLVKKPRPQEPNNHQSDLTSPGNHQSDLTSPSIHTYLKCLSIHQSHTLLFGEGAWHPCDLTNGTQRGEWEELICLVNVNGVMEDFKRREIFTHTENVILQNVMMASCPQEFSCVGINKTLRQNIYE